MSIKKRVEKFQEEKREEKKRFDKMMEEIRPYLKKKPVVVSQSEGHWQISTNDTGEKISPAE